MDIAEFFRTADLTRIQQFVIESQEEHLFLEFKILSKATLTRDDRRNLAVALSGFANASGGLVVWGVDARQMPSGADGAQSIVEIHPLSVALSRLNEFTGQYVTPVVGEVQHRALETANDRGVIVTLVPESDEGPHMALGPAHEYFKRSGSSFMAMEHYEIADMFGRRRRPKPELIATVKTEGTAGETKMVAILIGVRNVGRGSAKNLFIRLRVAAPYQIDRFGVDGNTREGLTRLEVFNGRDVAYGARPEVVLHPQMTHHVAAVRLDVPPGSQPLDCHIAADIAADDYPLTPAQLTVEASAIRNAGFA